MFVFLPDINAQLQSIASQSGSVSDTH